MKLHMPKRQRFAVACLFAMGIIVTVAGIVRTWFIYKSLMSTYDNTWYVQRTLPLLPLRLLLTILQVRLSSLDRGCSGDRSWRYLCVSSSPKTAPLENPLQSIRNLLGWNFVEEKSHWLWTQLQGLQDVKYSRRRLTQPNKRYETIIETKIRSTSRRTRPRP